MSTLTVRPIGPDEVDLFLSFSDASALGIKPSTEAYLDGLGRWYRPEWSWVALRDDRVVARVGFSGPPDAPGPYAMGSLEIGTGPDRVATGLALLRGAFGVHGPIRWHQFVPVEWEGDPAARAVIADRCEVARRAGLSFLVERLSLLRSGGGLPARPGRLEFRPVRDRAGLLPVVAGTVAGTLDAHMRADVRDSGLDAAVRAFVDQLPEPVSLWRFGYADGECVGVTVPGLTAFGPDIGYVGVLPTYRGRGYAEDLLLEATHLLVAGGGTEIGAMTDVGNTPMAAALRRCGYAVGDRMLVHTVDPGVR